MVSQIPLYSQFIVFWNSTSFSYMFRHTLLSKSTALSHLQWTAHRSFHPYVQRGNWHNNTLHIVPILPFHLVLYKVSQHLWRGNVSKECHCLGAIFCRRNLNSRRDILQERQPFLHYLVLFTFIFLEAFKGFNRTCSLPRHSQFWFAHHRFQQLLLSLRDYLSFLAFHMFTKKSQHHFLYRRSWRTRIAPSSPLNGRFWKRLPITCTTIGHVAQFLLIPRSLFTARQTLFSFNVCCRQLYQQRIFGSKKWHVNTHTHQ